MPGYVKQYTEAWEQVREFGGDQHWDIEQAFRENLQIYRDANPNDSREAALRNAVYLTKSEISETRAIRASQKVARGGAGHPHVAGENPSVSGFDSGQRQAIRNWSDEQNGHFKTPAQEQRVAPSEPSKQFVEPDSAAQCTIQQNGFTSSGEPAFSVPKQGESGELRTVTGTREQLDKVVAEHRLTPLELPPIPEENGYGPAELHPALRQQESRAVSV